MILITGAAGFIGSHLVRYLLDEGVDKKNLRLFVLNGESIENLPKVKLEIIYGDITNKNDVRKAVKGVDIVYHLAAVTNANIPGECMKINYGGTKNLILVLRKEKIKKFIFFSTIAIYGLPAFVGNRINISEKSKKQVVGEYAKSKYLAEKAVMKSGIPYVIIRPTTVYGPGDRAGINDLFRAIRGHYFFRVGDGKNKIDYVFVDDVVKGARRAELSRKKNSHYILGSGNPIPFKEIVDDVAKNIKVNVPDWYIPKNVALFLGNLADVTNKLSLFKIPFSKDRVKVMCSNCYFDISKANRELKYFPAVSFREGAKLTAEYAK